MSEVIDISPSRFDSSLWFIFPAFCMMYSAYNLNKQGDIIQPQRSPFLIWNQSVVPCLDLTFASWPAYRFLRRQVRWSDIPISLRIFHSLLWSTQSKTNLANEAEGDFIFLDFPCFLYDLMNVGILISGSFAFSKSHLYICKFLVHVLLKPSLKDFEHYLASMWKVLNCVVVCTFFGIAFLWDWKENWLFLAL